MSIKRIILMNNSRLLLEMFHRALEKADFLEVVQEVIDSAELPLAIQRFCPEWVILSVTVSDPVLAWISAFMQNDSSVRFIFVSPDDQRITIKGQMAYEADLSNLSLKEFIDLLEKDLQHI
jgi:DNA-binding NarL/FixJ family response regulator